MSSISSGCSLDEHVRTQMPYALLAMITALLVCYIPAGFGWFGPAVALPLGAVVALGVLWLFGTTTETDHPKS
jgi:Na+/H+ antiporter NhaC